MKRALLAYAGFVLATALLLLVAAVPIVASDLFRQPYSPAWSQVYRAMDLFRIDPFPTGGGAPPRFPYWRDPADAGIYHRDITLTTADGVKIAAWYVPACVGPLAPRSAAPFAGKQCWRGGQTSTEGAGARGTVILAHGLLESKRSMLHLVPWLHEAGYHVLLLDFRGHGESDRQPATIGPAEALDIIAALDWLEEEGANDRVAGLGMSLGAAALVNASAQDERLDVLVLDSLFATWNDTDFAAGYRLPPDWLVPGVPSPERLLAEIHVPLLIIHGTADILENVAHAHRLYRAANEPRTLWINDSGHAWSSWTYPDLYRERILGFFEQHLR